MIQRNLPHLPLRSRLGLPNDRLSSHAERTPHLPKHVQKRQLLRQRIHGKLLQCPKKRNLRRLRLPKPARTRAGNRTLYPQLQQRSNQRKVRRSESETIPRTNERSIEGMLCKTKSSKRNAYSIKSNFMGSLYKTSRTIPRGFLLQEKRAGFPALYLSSF